MRERKIKISEIEHGERILRTDSPGKIKALVELYAPTANAPTADEKAALAGTDGTPSSTNPYVTSTDPANTDARTPTAHAATHVGLSADLTNPATVMVCSSSYSPQWGPEKAVNNNQNNDDGWYTTPTTNQWLGPDFVSTMPAGLYEIDIQNCQFLGDPNAGIQHARIDISMDGANWTKVPVVSFIAFCAAYLTDEVTISKATNLTQWTRFVVNCGAFRFIRIFAYDNWSSGSGTAINELEIKSIGTDPLSSIYESQLTLNYPTFPTSHAANAATYGYGDGTNAGHLRVGTGLGVTTGTVSVTYGNTAGTACVGNDARLSDARTPTAHNTSHKHGGSDEIATATAAANAIPKAGADGKLAVGWIPDLTTLVHLAGTETITGDKTFTDSHNSFRGSHKSADDSAGLTVTFVVRTDVGTSTLVFKDGLLISKS